ncbi:MAG: hypothetical protein IPL12_14930 [Bacteroidetes bacterium]|nr:hypothetical protein [Bacteroidota bacterium]
MRLLLCLRSDKQMSNNFMPTYKPTTVQNIVSSFMTMDVFLLVDRLNGCYGTFPDRGMFYNHYDGGWGAAPTTRAESVRTGFGEIINVEDHEVIVSHDAGANKIQIFANDAIGSNSWTEKSGSDAIRGIWPVSYCPPGTDDIYVVCADTQFITSIQFFVPMMVVTHGVF